MQYISFYKDRLPFKPKSNVVIYFDVMGIGRKLYYRVLNRYYDRIVEEFRRGGLEFCYLPKIAADMDLEKIYHYFNPQASGKEHLPYIDLHRDDDLLEYVVVDFNVHNLSPGLIQYRGEGFDKEDTYTFSFTPIPSHFENDPISMVHQYVMLHGVHNAFFEISYNEQIHDITHINKRSNSDSIDCCDALQKQPSKSLSEEDVEMMMSEVQMLVERLRKSGVGEIALRRLFQPTQKLSRMHIRYGRIFLPDYNNMEIKMPPLSKAIYLLYLRHPDGIKFSYLPDHRDELLHLYEMISGRDNREDIRKSIDDVTDPTRNSINEKCSRIKQAFLREFDDSIAQNYYITGERGEAKKILLPTEMVTWEMPA